MYAIVIVNFVIYVIVYYDVKAVRIDNDTF